MSLKTILKQTGVYYRLRTSTMHDLYWMLADGKSMQERQAEISFYQQVLTGFQKGCLIFDIGANQGMKTDIFLRLGARVVAVEPNEQSHKIMAGKFLNHRLIKKPVTLVKKAIGDSRGTEMMWIEGPGSALNTFNSKWAQTLKQNPDRIGMPIDFSRQEKIEMVTLDDLIEQFGTPFFIKIDVEGYETNALRGLSRKVPFVSFEVNLPEFRAEGLECVKRLGEIAPEGAFNYLTDLGNGLALPQWLPVNDFTKLLTEHGGTGIEVFWKS